MTAYQLGQLFGLAIGGLGGAWLSYKLLKSKNKAVRGLGVGVGVLALAYLATAAIAAGPQKRRADFEQGFTNTCVPQCEAGSGDKVGCTAYCKCQVDVLLSRPDSEKVMKSLQHVKTEADLTPQFRSQILAARGRCMPPSLYDASFLASCTQGCEGDGCRDTCACVLGKLREGKDPREGTEWLLQNLDGPEPTAEGQARASAANAACAPSAPPE